ncbi:MAG TPA: hypothetical protein VFA71_03870 [Terriglobales bacterium]|nr:hypothetical protein [Terriglobales bacterium]
MPLAESNAVPIPTEQIERALASAAIPGFYGDVTITISIKPEAVEDVEFNIEREATLKASQPDRRPAAGGAMPERDQLVRQAVLRLKQQLHLRCGMIGLTGNFADGRLLDLKLRDTP